MTQMESAPVEGIWPVLVFRYRVWKCCLWGAQALLSYDEASNKGGLVGDVNKETFTDLNELAKILGLGKPVILKKWLSLEQQVDGHMDVLYGIGLVL
jgi:hypothetical protein